MVELLILIAIYLLFFGGGWLADRTLHRRHHDHLAPPAPRSYRARR